jgi:hypothetical protein
MTLTQGQLGQVEDRRQDAPFVWLVEIPIPDTVSPQVARITSHSEAVDYSNSSSGAALSYTPRNLEIDAIREDTKATQQGLRLTISNANRELLGLVDSYDGLEDVEVTLMLVNLETLSEPPYLQQRGRIAGVSATNAAITFELGRTDISRSRLPANRCKRSSCSSVYKGARCGYTGALPSCDKSPFGPNGCEAHSNLSRYGGFLGIPRS